MSIDAMSWAFKQQIKSGIKLLLLALADYANTDDLVWPSISALEEKTSQDRKTIMAGIHKLIELGYLSQIDEKAGRTGNVRVFKINRKLSTNGTKNGTVSNEKLSTNGTKFPYNGTKNGTVETVPNFPETVPNLVPVTLYNHKNHKEPPVQKENEVAVDNFENKNPQKPPNTSTEEVKPEVQLSITFRKHGVIATPFNPKIIKLVKQGITPEVVSDACEEAKASLGDGKVSLNYVIAILERWSREAKEIAVKGANKNGKPWYETFEGYVEKGKEFGIEYKGEFPEFRTYIDKLIGKSIGMVYDENSMESFDNYRKRVLDEYALKERVVA